MIHLKTYEAMNYGDKHFGIPIFNYFPWYKYGSLNTQPEIDEDLYKLASKICPPNLKHMTSIWFRQNNNWISSIPGNDSFGNDTIYIPIEEETLYVKGNQFSIDDWEDIEKIRLMYNIGTKKLSSEYKEFLNILDDFVDINIYIKENLPKLKFDFKLITNISNYIEISDDDVINCIKDYNGTNSFLYSLKDYFDKYGKLTYRQIEAAKKNRTDILGNIKNKPCLIINDDKSIIPTVKRLTSKGYTVIYNEPVIIIYK